MKLKIKPVLSLLGYMALVSCEEVIDLDLGKNEPRIVIEGTVTTDQGPYTVKINQSVDYGELNEFPPVSGATVSVKDDQGATATVVEVDEGIYSVQDIQGQNGRSYTIEVSYNGETYQASSLLPPTDIPIQSLEYTFEEETLFIDEGYYLTAYFADPIEETNYYRLRIFVNGEVYYFERDDNRVRDDNFWLINDKFFNGKLMDFEFPHTLKAGDKVDVELHQVDRTTFDYYRTLVDLMGVGGVAPANPLSNWSNGALGYFGAISVSYASMVIEEE